MKADWRNSKALSAPDPKIRFYLFHGYDPGQSRARAEQLLATLAAEKATIEPATLKTDPAILADEAAAMALFGGKRALWIEPAGEDIAEAVEALLGAPAAESPAIAVAGGLKKSSALLKLAEAHPLALAVQSYELNERDLERLVEDMARSEGLRLAPGIAARIATSCGGDRGIVAQELTKLALYLGASPASPALLDSDALEAVSAGSEGEWTHLGDLALSGNSAAVADELATTAGIDPIRLIRAVQRRLLMLAPLRAKVDHGRSVGDVMASAGNSVFFKEKHVVAKILPLWDSASLARVSERLGALERALMRSDSPPDVEALGEELVTIARQAGRGKR